jgi:hypothetical protein
MATSLRKPGPADLPVATQERARVLHATLEKYAAQLSAANELDPAVRKRGLAVVRRAADSAKRLIADAERAVVRRQIGGSNSSAKAAGDE